MSNNCHVKYIFPLVTFNCIFSIHGNLLMMMVDDLMKCLARMVTGGDHYHGNQQIYIMMPSGNYESPETEKNIYCITFLIITSVPPSLHIHTKL